MNKYLYLLAVLSSVCALTLGTAWGHGNEQHTKTPEKTGHMEAMYQLKEQIPEVFRVMNRTPVIPDDKSLERGEALFQKHCAVCHGAEGKGNGPAAKAMDPPPSSFLDLEHSAIYGPGEKFWIVSHGSGPTGMPGFGGSLSAKDRWDLVNHLYRLQGGSVD